MSKNQKGTMTSRRTITFFSILFAALFVALLGWPRLARTRQDQFTQKKQQVPTIDEYHPNSTVIFTVIIGIRRRAKWISS